ncbi:UNVERIFIED_CONTAM: hypothetical protein HDU68_009082 [Siphonaria sp. JEL0065]|nr:hypothetical protein HDU68_009082 [Siphonaria sp. JEL0065]
MSMKKLKNVTVHAPKFNVTSEFTADEAAQMLEQAEALTAIAAAKKAETLSTRSQKRSQSEFGGYDDDYGGSPPADDAGEPRKSAKTRQYLTSDGNDADVSDSDATDRENGDGVHRSVRAFMFSNCPKKRLRTYADRRKAEALAWDVDRTYNSQQLAVSHHWPDLIGQKCEIVGCDASYGGELSLYRCLHCRDAGTPSVHCETHCKTHAFAHKLANCKGKEFVRALRRQLVCCSKALSSETVPLVVTLLRISEGIEVVDMQRCCDHSYGSVLISHGFFPGSAQAPMAYGPKLALGSGTYDGETIERLWSLMEYQAGATQRETLENRLDSIFLIAESIAVFKNRSFIPNFLKAVKKVFCQIRGLKSSLEFFECSEITSYSETVEENLKIRNGSFRDSKGFAGDSLGIGQLTGNKILKTKASHVEIEAAEIWSSLCSLAVEFTSVKHAAKLQRGTKSNTKASERMKVLLADIKTLLEQFNMLPNATPGMLLDTLPVTLPSSPPNPSDLLQHDSTLALPSTPFPAARSVKALSPVLSTTIGVGLTDVEEMAVSAIDKLTHKDKIVFQTVMAQLVVQSLCGNKNTVSEQYWRLNEDLFHLWVDIQRAEQYHKNEAAKCAQIGKALHQQLGFSQELQSAAAYIIETNTNYYFSCSVECAVVLSELEQEIELEGCKEAISEVQNGFNDGIHGLVGL